MTEIERGASPGSAPLDPVEEFWSTRYELPELPRSYITRPRLITLLEKAERVPLIVVSAAPGAGKTLITAEWIAHVRNDAQAVWITFDESDDTDTFWRDVPRALKRAGIDVPSTALSDVDRSRRREFLVALGAALRRHPSRVRLVLDGYELSSPLVANDVDFLLRHTGSNLQVVITTRVDPILPLYRYRLQETVVEVRTGDLAFTRNEASRLLEASGLHLPPESVRTLHARTDGWAAGLRFAAMFLVECADPNAALRAVGGDSGNIAEYLMGEVLRAQSPRMRDLLLDTSIADTLQPGLIEELGGATAPRDLALLAKKNTFIGALKDRPGTYRYHPLFRDLLRAELNLESPDRWELLHHKAATWFADRGLLAPAIAHAAAVGAWADAADFLVNDLAVGQLLLEKGSGELTTLFEQMPDEVTQPAALVVRAALALATGRGERFDTELEQAQAVSKGGLPATQGALRLAISMLAAVRAAHNNDPEVARNLAKVAEDQLRRIDYSTKLDAHPELAALVLTSKGIGSIRAGQFADALEAFAAGESKAHAPGCEALLAECLGYQALINALRGRLTRADSLAVRSISVSDEINMPPAARPPSAFVARAWVAAERYDMGTATEYVRRARSSRLLTGDPVSNALAAVVAARLHRAHGDVSGALTLVARAGDHVAGAGTWLAEMLKLEALALQVARGNPEEAERDLEKMQPAANVAELALVTAQSQVAQGTLTAMEATLHSATARSASLTTQVAGALVELEHDLLVGEARHAQTVLERSLRLAAPEQLRRPFREASSAVHQLLRRNTALRANHPWLDPDPDPARPGGPQDDRPTLVVEPLTGKELEVLGYLADLMSTDEIAETMFVSANTIRTHVRNILRKLVVSRRNEAVRRARKLGLLDT